MTYGVVRKTRMEVEGYLYWLANSYIQDGSFFMHKFPYIALGQTNDGVKILSGDPRRFGNTRNMRTFKIGDLISDDEGCAPYASRKKISAIADYYFSD